MDKRVYIFMAIALISCISPKKRLVNASIGVISLNQDQLYIYNELRNQFFRSCLYHGYTEEERTFLQHDYSFAHDYPLQKEGYKVVDSLALILKEKIQLDSIYLFEEILLKDPVYLGRKRVLQICLEGYESEVVDSMAKVWAKKLSPADRR